MWVQSSLTSMARAGTRGKICVFPCSWSFYLLHALPDQCLTQPELRIPVYKHCWAFYDQQHSFTHSHQNTNEDYKLPFALHSQHNVSFFPFFRRPSHALSAEFSLLFVKQEQQQHLLLGKLHREQNSWEQRSSQRHQSRQLRQPPEPPRSSVTSFPAAFS